MVKPARAFPWRNVTVASTSCRPACAARVHAVRSMKQRGIASFFGAGKAENAPPTAKVASATLGKSAKTASHQESAEVLKDVNSSGTKRAREVIRAQYTMIARVLVLSIMPHQHMASLPHKWFALCAGCCAKHSRSSSRTGKQKQVEAYTEGQCGSQQWQCKLQVTALISCCLAPNARTVVHPSSPALTALTLNANLPL